MKTLTQYIEERLIINKNFKQKEPFTPKNSKEFVQYLNSAIDEMIEHNDNVLDMTNVEFTKPFVDSAVNEAPLYQIFKKVLSDVKRKDIIVDVSGWDMSIFKRIDCIFFKCECIETVIGLETWDVSNATDFAGLFSCCKNLKNINVTGWKPKKADLLMSVFYGCEKLQSIPGLDTWDFGDNTNINMENMFFNCRELNDIGDIEYWGDVVGKTDRMFNSCNNLSLPSWYSD